MVKEVQEKLETPIKTGNAIAMFLVGLAVLGFVFFYGSLKMLLNNIIVLPQQNKETINQLLIRQSVSEECIQQLKKDVQEIKDNQKKLAKI